MDSKLQIKLIDPVRLVAHLAHYFLKKRLCVHESNAQLTCILYDIMIKLGYDVTIVQGYFCIEPYPATILKKPNSFIECKYNEKVYGIDLQFFFQLQCQNPFCTHTDPLYDVYQPYLKKANGNPMLSIHYVQKKLATSKLDALNIFFERFPSSDDEVFYYKLSALFLKEAIVYMTPKLKN